MSENCQDRKDHRYLTVTNLYHYEKGEHPEQTINAQIQTLVTLTLLILTLLTLNTQKLKGFPENNTNHLSTLLGGIRDPCFWYLVSLPTDQITFLVDKCCSWESPFNPNPVILTVSSLNMQTLTKLPRPSNP